MDFDETLIITRCENQDFYTDQSCFALWWFLKICFEKQDRRCSICLVQRTSSTIPCSTPLWWWWNYCIKKRHWLVVSRLCKWIFFVPALCQNLQSLVICRAPRFSFVAHKIERVLLGQANVHLTNECVYINIPKTRNNWSLIESKDIRDFIFGGPFRKQLPIVDQLQRTLQML